MLKYILFFVLTRLGIQTVTNDYIGRTSTCNALVKLADRADIPAVRNAYCLEVVQEDQSITLQSLQAYKLGFLASNMTYMSDKEVMQYACKPPQYVTEFLEWTSGVTPLFCVWCALQLFHWLRGKMKRKVQPQEAPPPSPDKPPRIKLPPKAIPPVKTSKKYIREKKEEKSLMNNLQKIANMSPRLRQRIMNPEV